MLHACPSSLTLLTARTTASSCSSSTTQNYARRHYAPLQQLLLFSPAGPTSLQIRTKYTKTNSYRVPARHAEFSRAYDKRTHVGIRALSAEYVETGRTVVKQRKYISKNPNVTRRQKHFKLYPGENVYVDKDTSLVAMCSGRVKFTHDTERDVKIANVLPEAREELLEDDLWRYRTEHVRSMEENKVLVALRQKALPVFGKTWVSPPTGMRPAPVRLSKNRDSWSNPHVQDPNEFVEHAYLSSANIDTGQLVMRRLDHKKTCVARTPKPNAQFLLGKSKRRTSHAE
ncbi:unnamed protein product [Amoebophrya sp. A120]|nr:unnamed protein product [Amoebophrya sp. A120]|eukprot:GSA120T00010872001.1